MDNPIKVIETIETIIARHEKFKSAYFWKPLTYAGERRSYESYWSVPEIGWDEGGHHYTAAYQVRCTTGGIYAKGIYTKDGVTTNLKAIKYSLARLQGGIH